MYKYTVFDIKPTYNHKFSSQVSIYTYQKFYLGDQWGPDLWLAACPRPWGKDMDGHEMDMHPLSTCGLWSPPTVQPCLRLWLAPLNCWTDRYAVSGVDSRWLYGTMEYIRAQPGEYDWRMRARRRCGLLPPYYCSILFSSVLLAGAVEVGGRGVMELPKPLMATPLWRPFPSHFPDTPLSVGGIIAIRPRRSHTCSRPTSQ